MTKIWRDLENFALCECSGWRWYEVTWLAIAVTSLVGISLRLEDTPFGLVSAVAGVASVILTGKGKLSAYLFGIVNCTLYGIIAYGQTLYGETMLNLGYYLPVQFYGFLVWRKNMQTGGLEVVKRKMPWMRRSGLFAALLAATAAYGWILARMGDALPLVDSFTTVASVFAMWISCRRYAEQWAIWIAVDVVSIYMWWNRYRMAGENAATLLMWVVFLVNAIYGFIKWEREANRERRI